MPFAPILFHCSGHVCMVFERLGPSLYDFLRRNAYRPFPLAMVGGCQCNLCAGPCVLPCGCCCNA